MKSMGHGGRKEIAARFYAHYDVNWTIAVMLLEPVNCFTEAVFVFEQRGYVVEVYAGLGKIRNFTDELFQAIAS